MSIAVIDKFSVSAVMLRQASQHPWGTDVWSLLGVLPGLPQTLLRHAEQQGELHYWPNLTLQLHPRHCDAYYHNLMSGNPQLYFVSQASSLLIPSPLLITVDYDEASAYMETGEHVFNTPLPDELCKGLEHFVLIHYHPQKPQKRARKQWHEINNGIQNDTKNGS